MPEQMKSTTSNACEESLKNYRDIKTVLDSSYEKGMEKGLEERQNKGCAKYFFQLSVNYESISEATGLSEEEPNHIT